MDPDRPDHATEPGVPMLHLGRFAPPLAARIAALLQHRGIPHAAEAAPDDDLAPSADPTDTDARQGDGEPEVGDRGAATAVEVALDADWRDDVAAELFTNWAELLRGLSPEEAALVWPRGGSHPGWYDPPADAWIDEHGRLQVADEGDEGRAIGPALAIAGLTLLLLGVTADTIPTGFGVTFGLLGIVVGLLLPH